MLKIFEVFILKFDWCKTNITAVIVLLTIHKKLCVVNNEPFTETLEYIIPRREGILGLFIVTR